MTAFYMFRVIYLAFTGESRAIANHGHDEGHHAAHESPAVMVIPMVVLGVLAIFSGFWNIGGQFTAFLGEAGESQSFLAGFFGVFTHPLPWIALAAAGLGILLAHAMYGAKWISAEKVSHMFKPFYSLFFNKYWMDALYEKVVVKFALLGGLFAGFQQFDTHAIDGAVNGVADVTVEGGRVARRMQTGQLQLYALTIGIGLVAIIVCVFIFGK
jgi:NADH-quinone oxidoreductase subunit L